MPPGIVVRRACTPTGPERCFDARDDNCNGIIDEGCGVNTGLVQFAIAWDEANADVDLNVTDPDGELVEVGRVTQNGLTKERDCPGRHSECRGQNLENVFLEDGDPTRGDYRVRVRLEKLGRRGTADARHPGRAGRAEDLRLRARALQDPRTNAKSCSDSEAVRSGVRSGLSEALVCLVCVWN